MSAKYHFLAEQLEQRIEKLGFNAPLPSERDLSLEFNVSRMTIRSHRCPCGQKQTIPSAPCRHLHDR